MRGSKCLFSSAAALRKVFINNAGAAWETPGQLQRLLLPAITAPVQPPSWPSSSLSRRPFSTNPVVQGRYNRTTPDTDKAAPPKQRAKRDYDIVFPWIQIRQDDGTLTEPLRTSSVLKKMNKDRHTLILLATPRTSEETKGPEYPICRLGDRKAELAAEQEAKAAQKKALKVVTKEVEINWAIAPNDLNTWLTRTKKFLSKGYHVRVTLMTLKKRKKRKATVDEAKEVLKVVEEAIAEVPGAKETKPREGKVGETLVLVLHAPAGKAASATTEANAETEADPAKTLAANSAEEKPDVSTA
jgi:translation initiation factor IF-3